RRTSKPLRAGEPDDERPWYRCPQPGPKLVSDRLHDPGRGRRARRVRSAEDRAHVVERRREDGGARSARDEAQDLHRQSAAAPLRRGGPPGARRRGSHVGQLVRWTVREPSRRVLSELRLRPAEPAARLSGDQLVGGGEAAVAREPTRSDRGGPARWTH